MRVQSLEVVKFRNHSNLELEFEKDIICLVGNNGTGKTSLLDAIYYVCNGRSNFTSLDQILIQQGNDYFNLRCIVEDVKVHEVFAAFQIGKRKNFKLDGVPYKKLSEHIGKFGCVMIAPKDVEIILEGGEVRRSLIDSTISFFNPFYLEQLMRYSQLIQQRNAELKRLSEENASFGSELIEIYNQQLIPINEFLFSERKMFVEEFLPVFLDIYGKISPEGEQVGLQYYSQLLSDEVEDLFHKTIKKDIILARTTVGIHRDDLMFFIHQMEAKKVASQGQIKSLVMSFKLSVFEYLRKKTGKSAILMLDDVCDRLDNQRVEMLFKVLKSLSIPQVFITDTSKMRLETLLGIGNDIQWIELT